MQLSCEEDWPGEKETGLQLWITRKLFVGYMKSFVVWRYQLDVTVFPRGVLILFTNRWGALGEIIKNMLHFMALTTVFLITSMLYKPGLESKGDHSWEPVFSSDFMQFSSVHFYLVKIWDNTGIPIGIASWQGSPEETRRLIKPGLPSHKEISKMKFEEWYVKNRK